MMGSAVSDVEEEVENLFLLGRFEEAFDACHTALEWIADRSSPLSAIKSNGLDSNKPQNENPVVERMKREMTEHKARRGGRFGHRRFHDAEEEETVMRMVILLIQILYELKRQREVTPFVRWFYSAAVEGSAHHGHEGSNNQDVHAIPYQVFLLMINLEISLENFSVARDLVKQYFSTPKPSEKGKEKSLELTGQQQTTLVELYIAHILIPMRQYSDARKFLHSMQSALPPQFAQTMRRDIDRAEEEERRLRETQARKDIIVTDTAVVLEDDNDDVRPIPTADEEPDRVVQEVGELDDGDKEAIGMAHPEVRTTMQREFAKPYHSSSSSSSSSSRSEPAGGSIVRSGSKMWGLIAGADRGSLLSTIMAPFTGRWRQAALLYYYGTIFAGILTLFWFVYSKNERLRKMRDSIVSNLRELLGSAFSYDRTSLNQHRRRRLGN